MMVIYLSLVISLLLTLLSMAVAWGTQPIKIWQITVIFGISVVLWILGAALSLGWYPWTNIFDFLVPVGAGILLGRVIPAKFWPFFIFLLVMSILDVTQILLTTHASAPTTQSATVPAGQLYVNFFLQLPWGKYDIGIFDLLIIAAIGVYWCRQNRSFLIAFAGIVIGLIVAYTILYLNPGTPLPLIPFLMLGWLCSAGMYRYHKQSKPEGVDIVHAE